MIAATNVEFTSYVDSKGYEIVPAKRPPRKPGQDEADWILNSPMKAWVEARIVGRGGNERAVRLSQYPHLFSTFAKIKKPEELLAFITEYGRLTSGNRGDEIPPLLDEAKSMRRSLKPHPEIRPSMGITNLRAWLTTDKAKGTVSVKIAPVRLLDALWLQLGQSLAGGTQWLECKGCGVLFAIGGNSGKRSVSKFHSDECRIKFNSLERSRR